VQGRNKETQDLANVSKHTVLSMTGVSSVDYRHVSGGRSSCPPIQPAGSTSDISIFVDTFVNALAGLIKLIPLGTHDMFLLTL
jgi:hypothetical protein